MLIQSANNKLGFALQFCGSEAESCETPRARRTYWRRANTYNAIGMARRFQRDPHARGSESFSYGFGANLSVKVLDFVQLGRPRETRNAQPST